MDNRVPPDAALLARIEACYDAIPRQQATVEYHGSLVLFVQDGPGWPLYARPGQQAEHFPVADILTVRRRQRQLGLPEAFEWVHELAPNLLPVAEEAGLSVLRAPLMVFDPTVSSRLGAPATATVRLLDPTSADFAEDLAETEAVAAVAFRSAGTATGPAGTVERDQARKAADPDHAARVAARIAAGHTARAVAETPDDGALAVGAFQRADDVAEIVGVATLPSQRGRGLGSFVTAHLRDHALSRGAEVVFLSAATDDLTRMYGWLGFRRIGTACIAEPADPQ